MNCCFQCFASPHIRDKINRNNQSGDCHFCGKVSTLIIDARELSIRFQSILDLYSIDEKGSACSSQIPVDFPQIFSEALSKETIQTLLEAIFADDLSVYGEYLEREIALSNINPRFQKEVTSLQLTWDGFVNEIKEVNRFHIKNLLDLTTLEKLLKIFIKKIDRGTIFYRGRISDADGYPKSEMLNPPGHLASSGRANPIGISYLYLANELRTTLFETRAAQHDYVTVGDFRLLENFQVIDLKHVSNQDPFDIAENELLEEYVAYLPFVIKLGNELSKPVRRNDSELDYLPTQYLTEFIKSMGVEAVVYGSSLDKKGYNLAVFDAKKIECLKTGVYEITDIKFNHQLIR